MKWLSLTSARSDEKDLMVNFDLVCGMHLNTDGKLTFIYTVGDTFFLAKETPEDIIKMLDNLK